MLKLLRMCFEFFKTGLFSVGGGLATLPFLTKMAQDYPDWFTLSELADMVAVAESTPGPIGVNMATYVGYKVFGLFGGFASTFSLVLPSFIVILIVSSIWEKYKNAESVQKIFAILRAAAIGLIISAGTGVFISAVFPEFTELGLTLQSLTDFSDGFENLKILFNSLDIKPLVLFAFVMAMTQMKRFKNIHPIFFIGASAFIGIVLSF